MISTSQERSLYSNKSFTNDKCYLLMVPIMDGEDVLLAATPVPLSFEFDHEDMHDITVNDVDGLRFLIGSERLNDGPVFIQYRFAFAPILIMPTKHGKPIPFHCAVCAMAIGEWFEEQQLYWAK